MEPTRGGERVNPLAAGAAGGAGACSPEGAPVFDVTQPPFGARGDGRTDDTAAIQRAVDAARRESGATVLFPRGTYLVDTVNLAPGMTLEGQAGAVIRRPPRPPRGRDAAAEGRVVQARKWLRTFTTEKYAWDADQDSPLLTVRGLTFDGGLAEQGAYARYELQQAHLLFLTAATRRRGKLRALVERCAFRNSVADGLSVYTNCSVRVADCTAVNCFRGAVVVTGGHTDVSIERLTTSAGVITTGIDVEVDGAGYGGTKRVDVKADQLDLEGDFDVHVSDGGSFTGSRIVCRAAPFFLAAPGSTVDISDSEFTVGPLSSSENRVVWPHRVTLTRCTFHLSEAGTGPEANRTFAALHVYWNISGTSRSHQQLRLVDCRFRLRDDIEPADRVYAVYAEADLRDQENWLIVQGGDVGRGFDEGFHMAQGGAWTIERTRIDADTAFWWASAQGGYDATIAADRVTVAEGSRYMHIQTYGPRNLLTHRQVVLDESASSLSTGEGLAGNVYRGGRIIMGNSPPVGRRVPGLQGDVFRLKHPVAGQVWEWSCTASDAVSAVWRPGAVFRR